MPTSSLHKMISEKGSNPAQIAEQVIQSPELIRGVFQGLSAEQPSAKYGCEKVLRKIGEHRPDLLYPYFDFFTGLLDCDNSFLKWGAIASIANMARADSANRFESVFDRYFAPVRGPVMITAANIVAGSARIALAKPHLADRIAVEILKVGSGKYKTAECRNIAIGHAIDAFDKFFDHIQGKARIVRFVKKQLQNSRPPVRKRAERFLRKRKIPF